MPAPTKSLIVRSSVNYWHHQTLGYVMKSWLSIKAKAAGAAEIKIYDEIGMWGITFANFPTSW